MRNWKGEKKALFYADTRRKKKKITSWYFREWERSARPRLAALQTASGQRRGGKTHVFQAKMKTARVRWAAEAQSAAAASPLTSRPPPRCVPARRVRRGRGLRSPGTGIPGGASPPLSTATLPDRLPARSAHPTGALLRSPGAHPGFLTTGRWSARV